MTKVASGITSINDIASPELAQFLHMRNRITGLSILFLGCIMLIILAGMSFHQDDIGPAVAIAIIGLGGAFNSFLLSRGSDSFLSESKFCYQSELDWEEMDRKFEIPILELLRSREEYAEILKRVEDGPVTLVRAEAEYLHRYDIDTGGKGIPDAYDALYPMSPLAKKND